MAIVDITEALETRRYQPGQVKFSKSDWNDPHIQSTLKAIATAEGVDVADVIADINTSLAKIAVYATKAPTLYKTIKDNLIENELFNRLSDLENVDLGASQFRERTFFKLVRTIAAEHDEFWPLRSYIDGRRLQPKFEFVTLPMSSKEGVTTAAATPNGTFIFNTVFMQKLLDYAQIKNIEPKGKKYTANGGDIPNGYAYIEFLILHEFMHYTNDDFHYQKVIPNADPKIINWVGDFRSNYLLVKSGYEQLPIGLYNDDINYDRQTRYVDMYDIVKKEFEALQDPKAQQEMQSILDGLGDDHEPGQAEGAGQPTDGMSPDDIDKASNAASDRIKKGEDLTTKEAADKAAASGPGAKQGPPGGSGANGNNELDYKSINPTFNWKTLIKRFFAKAMQRSEETYSKPSRRSVSSMDTARQVGAAAIKPAEKPLDFVDAKIGFCIDSSGSMGGVINQVMATAVDLLKTPKFKYAQSMVAKFSSTHEIYKVNFAQNKAAKVSSVKDKVKSYPLNTDAVFSVHFGAGTDFSPALAEQMIIAAKDGWNVVFFFDYDIIASKNLTNFCSVLKAAPANTFVIFDSRATYVAFRKAAGMSTPNITYFD